MLLPGRHAAPRAGIVLAALAAIALLASAVTPLVPSAHAADASPSPAASPSEGPSPSPTTTPSPDPSPTPAPTPSPDPAPAPTTAPSPSPATAPSAVPSPSPSASPSPAASASPAPSPTPAATPPPSPEPSLSAGQRTGTDSSSPIPVYRLVAPAAVAGPTTGPSGFVSPHTGLAFSLSSDACAACHSGHTAQGRDLLGKPAPVANQCFGCHDSASTGSSFATQREYTATGVQANDATTDSYYQHPSTVVDGHTSGTDDEFGGVSNRHASCVDCHQPHRADGTPPTQTTGGWGASGAIVGASGVVVTNTSGAAPSYSFSPNGISLEYQLCFKCHSGFTVLPSNGGKPPSWWALDKATELDPANARSYHPVEAAGTNATAAMAASLNGTSPYKLWDFTVADTVRCTSCHAGPVAPAKGTTADATLPPHASTNRGILILPYRDRQLKAAKDDPYDAADFALCYACHAEAPYLQSASTDSLAATNFKGTATTAAGTSFQSLHALHLTGLAGFGSGGTDIDVAGAGQGDALCAECHFRLHSTAQAYRIDEQSNTRLVNFAPDVEPAQTVDGPVLAWIAATATTPASCTLTCHGHAHIARPYGP